ncbi:MAG TPA: hypothetical protein VLI06_03870 [Solimonas sp.]|nr:hypothetical protein [Solimonas sp.]
MSSRFLQTCRSALLLSAGLCLGGCASVAAAAPQPPAPPQVAALIEQCTAVMPRAHPWRARQLRQAMFRMQVSMSYRAAGAQLNPSEQRAAMAAERDSYELLFETCRPLLT